MMACKEYPSSASPLGINLQIRPLCFSTVLISLKCKDGHSKPENIKLPAVFKEIFVAIVHEIS